MNGHNRLRLFRFLIGLYLATQSANAQPCLPHDPDGENPGSLCPPYASFTIRNSINPSAFQQGYASDGYSGMPLGKNLPGTPIVPGHQPGTPMDRHVGGNGFWSSIRTNESGTTVRTNTGSEWHVPSRP